VGLFWILFFDKGPTYEVDTHFTRHPEDFPEFRISSWRPSTPGRKFLVRDGTYPLTFFTLRYTQVSEDGGATFETAFYNADVRWGPTAAAMIVSMGIALLLCFIWLRMIVVRRRHYAVLADNSAHTTSDPASMPDHR
jgi:hypothetical protein